MGHSDTARPIAPREPTEYTQALERLRSLMVVQAALETAIAAAAREVVDAAAREGTEPGPLTGVRPLPSGVRQPPATRPLQPAHGASTRHVLRAIGSAEVERHVRDAWARAETDAGRARVRHMLRSSAASGTLAPDAVARLAELTR